MSLEESVPSPALPSNLLAATFDEFCDDYNESGDCRHTVELTNGATVEFLASQSADLGAIAKGLWKALMAAKHAGTDKVTHRVFWAAAKEDEKPFLELGGRIRPERPIDFRHCLSKAGGEWESWWIVDKHRVNFLACFVTWAIPTTRNQGGDSTNHAFIQDDA